MSARSTASMFEDVSESRSYSPRALSLLGIAALAGIGLTTATVLQARTAPGPAQTVSGRAPVLTPGHVAAEGRIVTYPGGEVAISAERPGRLLQVLITEGQQVTRGQALAQIDAEELRAARDEVRARIAEAEADVSLADATLRRRQELVAQQIVATHGLDEARRDLDAARARLATAKATLERHEVQLRKAVVRSPIDGTVIARRVDAGESVDVGSPVATIADLSRVRVDAEADEADAGALVEGARASVRADGYPGRVWRGVVEEIGDAVASRHLRPKDPGRPSDTRIVSVKVALTEPTPLKLGTTVELSIDTPSAR